VTDLDDGKVHIYSYRSRQNGKLREWEKALMTYLEENKDKIKEIKITFF